MHASVLALGALAGAALGCSSATDVVAEGTTRAAAPGFSGVQELPGCEPGAYRGTFRGTYGPDTFLVEIEGDIDFVLEDTLDGEFLTISNSHLTGTTNTTLTFSAVVESESSRGCREGRFEGLLVDGEISGGLTFEGTVEGDYEPNVRAFFGSWETTDPVNGFVGSGEWSAQHGR